METSSREASDGGICVHVIHNIYKVLVLLHSQQTQLPGAFINGKVGHKPNKPEGLAICLHLNLENTHKSTPFQTVIPSC